MTILILEIVKIMDRHCAHCGHLLHGSICHHCGQEVIAERWSTRVLARQFVHHLTNIEKGFLFTGKSLFQNPGRVIHDYWKGITVIYYNPFRYVIIWTAINLLINFWLGIDDLLQESMMPATLEEAVGEQRMVAADQQFDSWLNLLVLLLIPVNSFFTGVLFKRHAKNYAEHLILNSYLLGQQSLITALPQFIFYSIPSLMTLYLPFNFLIGFAYNTFVFRRTFKESVGISAVKALGFGIAGLAVFFGLVALFSALAVGVS